RAFFMASNTVSSACSALVRDTLGFFARMAFTMSSLITDPPVPSFWPETYARQGVCGLSSRPVIHCRARPIRKMAESKFRGRNVRKVRQVDSQNGARAQDDRAF